MSWDVGGGSFVSFSVGDAVGGGAWAGAASQGWSLARGGGAHLEVARGEGAQRALGGRPVRVAAQREEERRVEHAAEAQLERVQVILERVPDEEGALRRRAEQPHQLGRLDDWRARQPDSRLKTPSAGRACTAKLVQALSCTWRLCAHLRGKSL